MPDPTDRSATLGEAACRVVARLCGVGRTQVDLRPGHRLDHGDRWLVPVLDGARVVATVSVERPPGQIPLETQYAVQELLADLAPGLGTGVAHATPPTEPVAPTEAALLADLADLAGPALGRAVSSLVAAVEALHDPPADDRSIRYLARVRAGTVKLQGFRQALAAYAEAGREPRVVEVDLAAAVRDALADLGPDLAEARATVEEAHGRLRADREAVRVLLRHLLRLSLRGRRGIPLRLSVTLGSSGPAWTLGVLCRAGVESAPGSVPAHAEGGDLDLAVCARVAAAHNGWLSREEDPAGGEPVLTVHLPRAATPSSPPAAAEGW